MYDPYEGESNLAEDRADCINNCNWKYDGDAMQVYSITLYSLSFTLKHHTESENISLASAAPMLAPIIIRYESDTHSLVGTAVSGDIHGASVLNRCPSAC
jgi:hypothetical protein